MAVIVNGYAELPCHDQVVTLGDAQYVVRLTYRQRCSSWYLDLFDSEENPLVVGRRISPGWPPLVALQIDGLPDGLFIVVGRDGYAEADLGTALQLHFYSADELAAAADADAEEDDGVLVEIVP
jgi:hypothetical protein